MAEASQKQDDVLVIYLTAHSDPATLARAKVTAPLGFILKPYETRDLAAQIDLALYRHQAEQELREQCELQYVPNAPLVITQTFDEYLFCTDAAVSSFIFRHFIDIMLTITMKLYFRRYKMCR